MHRIDDTAIICDGPQPVVVMHGLMKTAVGDVDGNGRSNLVVMWPAGAGGDRLDSCTYISTKR